MKSKFSKYLGLFLMLAFLSVNVTFAAEAKVERPVLKKITLQDNDGATFKVSLISYKNHLGSLEVRIEASAIPRFASHVNPLLGFGRDTDQNGKIDTWFFLSKIGIAPVVLEGKSNLGEDVLGNLLIKEYRSTLSMYVSSAATSLFSYLLLSVNSGVEIQEEYFRDWMDLEQMRLGFNKEFNDLSGSYNYNQYMYHYQLLSIGYKELAHRMENFGKRTYWGLALADVGLWITGGVVLEWGGRITAKIGGAISDMAFLNAVKEAFFGLLEKQKALIENRLSSLKAKINGAKIEIGMKRAEKELFIALTVSTWRQALSNTLRAQQVKQRLRMAVKRTTIWPLRVIHGVKTEWKYIALNTSIQIGAEAAVRYDDIYNSNPAVMAKNLLTNPEVLENVGFMAADTIMMTGVSKSLTTTKAKFLASGAVALTNSSIMNFAIKDEADVKRVAFDTAWESIAGNAQVQLDLKALEYFEKMALKKGNPKIKLLGYLVVLIDQGIGYASYSKLSSAIDKDKMRPDPLVMLVPVLAEKN